MLDEERAALIAPDLRPTVYAAVKPWLSVVRCMFNGVNCMYYMVS